MISFTNVKEVRPLPPEGKETWWRAEIRTYAKFDPWSDGDYTGSHDVIELTPFEVLKHTPRGAWVRSWLASPSFVRGTAKRQLAVPTKLLALEDLRARKSHHAKMAQVRADIAKRQLEDVENAIRTH